MEVRDKLMQISIRFSTHELSGLVFPRDVVCKHIVSIPIIPGERRDFLCVIEFPDSWNLTEAKDFIDKVKRR